MANVAMSTLDKSIDDFCDVVNNGYWTVVKNE
jgi:hypothetical protein